MIQEPLGIQQIGRMLISLSEPLLEAKMQLEWEILVLCSRKPGISVFSRHLEVVNQTQEEFLQLPVNRKSDFINYRLSRLVANLQGPLLLISCSSFYKTHRSVIEYTMCYPQTHYILTIDIYIEPQTMCSLKHILFDYPNNNSPQSIICYSHFV